MKDFVRMLIMLVLVFAAMAGVVYLNYALNQTTLAVVAGVLAVVIIVLVYRNFHRWFGPRRSSHCGRASSIRFQAPARLRIKPRQAKKYARK